jgi:hypothetical protein
MPAEVSGTNDDIASRCRSCDPHGGRHCIRAALQESHLFGARNVVAQPLGEFHFGGVGETGHVPTCCRGDRGAQYSFVRVTDGDRAKRHRAIDQRDFAGRRQAAAGSSRIVRRPRFIEVAVERFGPLAAGGATTRQDVTRAMSPRALDVFAGRVPLRWNVAFVAQFFFQGLLFNRLLVSRLLWRRLL